MSVLMGGSRQVRNSVDAAVLNVGKRVVETKVPSSSAFADVADSQGTVGLSNINRVWGKAVLVNANAKEIKDEGLDRQGQAAGSANTSYEMAQQVNDNLVEKLSDKTTLNMYFRHTAKKRGASLLGSAAALDKADDTQYQIAMVSRGAESNIKFKDDQLPEGVTVNKVSLGSNNYVQGYTPITVNGKSFMFTSFRNGEMPHLISDSIFAKSKPTISPTGGANPVPNAWHASGIVVGDKGSLRASASAVANPQRTFDMTIPYGYISIRISSVSKWYKEGQFVKPIVYGNSSTVEQGFEDATFSDDTKFNGFSELGKEFSSPSLLAYVDKVPGDKEIVYEKMAQRLRQVDPTYTKERVRGLFATQVIEPGASVYYIFPEYKSADRTDPNIVIKPNTGSLPGWLTSVAPEGGRTELLVEQKLEGEPNRCWGDSESGQQPECHTIFTGKINWQPGTGFKQCLGEVWFARETRINFVPHGADPTF